MLRTSLVCILTLATSTLAQPAEVTAPVMRPAAVPLITHDPYFSVWSMTENLTDNWPRHWSGGTMGMAGLVWVDGKVYRWCGSGGGSMQNVPAAQQTLVAITPSETNYSFMVGESAGGTHGAVMLDVTFCSTFGPGDSMAQISESVSSVMFSARSLDAAAHEVRVYVDLSGEWCTSDANDKVSWSRHRVAGMEVLSMGRVEQPVLVRSGDQRKIDWGRVYLAAGKSEGGKPMGGVAVASDRASRGDFIKSGGLLESDDLRSPRAANDDWPVLAAAINLGTVEKTPSVGHVLIGYDEQEAIELFGRKLKPLWAHYAEGGFADILASSEDEWRKGQAPNTFENGKHVYNTSQQGWKNMLLLHEAREVGGDRYAQMVSLAYRQVLAGHKIVADWDGTPLMFSKENTSNGCIATIDVIYPACPFFLYHNPAMLRAQLLPLMQYAASPRWKFPFAPHDLGQYPKANGQVYGGGERTEENQMPVEESGNMLIMLGALAKVEPKESVKFCEPYWPTLEKWAVYLKDNGLDPANQLCTDDFAGHLARNVNLSAKTVVALGAYAQLLATAGKTEEAKSWRATAEQFARHWETSVYAAGGDATPLVFGDAGKGTWSQKYNLIWDRVLGLNLFPPSLYKSEMAHYRTKLQKYGLPLDSRRTYTKLDWTCWSACLTGSRADFDVIMAPVFDWANASPPPSRVPLSDWYETTDGKTQGMYARTVVGGLWMPLLIEKLKQPADVAPPAVK